MKDYLKSRAFSIRGRCLQVATLLSEMLFKTLEFIFSYSAIKDFK